MILRYIFGGVRPNTLLNKGERPTAVSNVADGRRTMGVTAAVRAADGRRTITLTGLTFVDYRIRVCIYRPILCSYSTTLVCKAVYASV